MARRALLALSFLLTTVSLTLFITGGFVTSVLGIRVSARSPVPAAAGAVLALGAWAFVAGRARARADDLARIDEALGDRAPLIILVVAGLAAAVTVHYGTFSAAGSDASGYLSQAAMLADGQLSHREPMATVADWADAASTIAPLGWRAFGADEQVPTYPVGLPLLMAPLHAVGGTLAACLIVPLSLFAAVWATGTLAHRLAGPAAAVLAAVWFATSPIALVAGMQPMGDVPVTAAWLVCWVTVLGSDRVNPATVVGPAWPGLQRGSRAGVPFGRAIFGGFAAAAAVLIRPNLAPLVVVPAAYLLFGDRDHPIATRVRRVAAFSAPVAVAGLVIAYLQWRWFGSPFRSGYGTAEEIYALENVAPNAALYARWLLDTHGPWLLAAPLAAFLVPLRPIRWLLGFAALVVLAYLIYAVFELWTYLRFLLPAVAILMIAAASGIAAIMAKLAVPVRTPALAVAVLAVAGTNIASAREHEVFRLADRHHRALLSGRYLEPNVAPNGVIVSGEQSGALRYYTGRSVLRWDVVTPDPFAAAIDHLTRAGYDVWIVLDEWEEEFVRRKFPGTAAAALDWPPVVEAGTEIRTRGWRLRDRDRFMRGAHVITDRLR